MHFVRGKWANSHFENYNLCLPARTTFWRADPWCEYRVFVGANKVLCARSVRGRVAPSGVGGQRDAADAVSGRHARADGAPEEPRSAPGRAAHPLPQDASAHNCGVSFKRLGGAGGPHPRPSRPHLRALRLQQLPGCQRRDASNARLRRAYGCVVRFLIRSGLPAVAASTPS